MRWGKLFIALLTVLLIGAAVVGGTSEYAWDGTVGLTVRLTLPGGTEELSCWRTGKNCYFFLPAGAELEQLRLYTHVTNEVRLDGQRITEGMSCGELQTDTPYALCYVSGGEEYPYTLTFLSSANVPALYIDTASGSMEYIHEDKDHKERGTLRLYGADGTLEHAGDLEFIKGRGNSTWTGHRKKPYNLTLTADGDLLGMGAAKRWILLANAEDQSHLRNKLAMDLAREAGLDYTPEGEWVDLYLNGEYAGLYLLCERNEVHEQRVDIAGEGSFLVEKDWEWRFRRSGDAYIMTQADTALQINYSTLSEEELLAALQSMENAILAPDGIDPETGKHWQEIIDLESWVKKYLVEEILANVDASTLSQFYYRSGTDGKICAGPVWDMDLTLRQASAEWLQRLDRFYGNDPHVYGSSWLPALYRDETFYSCLVQTYEETFLPLLEKLREEGLEAYSARIRQSARMNSVRWDKSAMDTELEKLTTILDERLDFLNRVWIQGESYVLVTVHDDGGSLRTLAIPAGETLPELPEYEDTQTTVYHGWYYTDTGLPVDGTQPLWEDLEIELRYDTLEPEVQEAEPEEPLSLSRLGPAIVFGLLLICLSAAGLWQARSPRKREKLPIGE